VNHSEPAESIAQSLARLRGRRGPGGHEHRRHRHPEHHGEHFRGFGPPMMRGGGVARLRMLEVLATASAPLSVSDIGEAIGVDQPRASRLVQQGVELGHVAREADPDDARRTLIALTEQGRLIAGKLRGQRRASVEQALEAMQPDEQSELARLLKKLADNWPG
jgi:DNA-binding MarR family transcriptional regulator